MVILHTIVQHYNIGKNYSISQNIVSTVVTELKDTVNIHT